MSIQEYRFQISGILDEVPNAIGFVSETAEQAGLSEQGVYHCQLAVDEACTNIIEHGYGFNGADHFIEIICQVKSPYFIIGISDDSPAFNPLARPDPDPESALDERSTGGWGVFFIKKVMDQVSYAYRGNRNHLVMMKRIDSNAG